MDQDWQYLALMRHGHSHANAAVRQGGDSQYYRVSGSDEAVELDARGVFEVTCTADLLAELFPTARPLATVWTSQFKRVIQSADLISASLNYEPERKIDKRLAKRSYGEFWNLTYKGVAELHPEENAKYEREGSFSYRPPGGENYPDLFDRTDEFFEQELSPAIGNILVVTHMVVLLSMQRRLEGLSDEEVLKRYNDEAVPNGCIMLYRRLRGTNGWQLHRTLTPDVASGDEGEQGFSCRFGIAPDSVLKPRVATANPPTGITPCQSRAVERFMERNIDDIRIATHDAQQRSNPDPSGDAFDAIVEKYIDKMWDSVSKAATKGKETARIVIPYRRFGRKKYGEAIAERVKDHFKQHGFTGWCSKTLMLDRPEVCVTWTAGSREEVFRVQR